MYLYGRFFILDSWRIDTYNREMNCNYCVLFTLPVLLVLPLCVFADTSPLQTLSGIPGLENAQTNSSDGFAPFINALYNMSIGIGSVLAVFVIIYAGIRHAASDSFGVKDDLKQRITMALSGLVLLLGAYVFLTFINPDLVKFNVNELDVPSKEVKHIQATDAVDTSASSSEPDQVSTTPPNYPR